MWCFGTPSCKMKGNKKLKNNVMQSTVQLIVISALSASFSERSQKSGKLPSGSAETHRQNLNFQLNGLQKKAMQVRKGRPLLQLQLSSFCS